MELDDAAFAFAALGQPTRLDLLRTLLDAGPSGLAAGEVAARLLEEGARDAYTTAVGMKKGRPGVLLTVLCDPADADRLAAFLFAQTPTIGLRRTRAERVELVREPAVVRLPEGDVVLKVVTLPDGTRRARPEYESLAALARDSGRPLDALAAEALRAFDATQRG